MTLLGRSVDLLRLPLWFMLFSVEELNLTIMVEFILVLVACRAAALMLFKAVRPAEVAPCPLTWSIYWLCPAFCAELLLLLRC